MTPLLRGEFARLLKGHNGEVDLAHAALLVAADEYPALDIPPYLERINELAQRVKKSAIEGGDPLTLISALNTVLFDEEGFKGNPDDYYDPRNCFLNEVLDRKTGIPISLSILYMEVARRAHVPLLGIGLPGHFIVGMRTPSRMMYIDPYHRGQRMTVKECAERVSKIFDGHMALTPEHLEPVAASGILLRLLVNLKNIYLESRSFAKAHAAIDKMALCAPEDWTHVRDRGLVRYHMKHFASALADLRDYLKNAGRVTDRTDIVKLEKLILKEMKESP